MMVDGGGLDNNRSANETEGARRSSRIQEQNNHQAQQASVGTSKPKRCRPKPKSMSQPKPKPKPEPEKLLGNLSDLGTESNPINVDFLQQGSIWDPDGLDAYVSYYHIRHTLSNACFRDSRRKERLGNVPIVTFPATEQSVRASFMLLPLQERKSNLNLTSTQVDSCNVSINCFTYHQSVRVLQHSILRDDAECSGAIRQRFTSPLSEGRSFCGPAYDLG